VTSGAFDISDEVRQCPALTDEIVDQKIATTALQFSNEQRLVCEPLKPARPCVTNRIDCTTESVIGKSSHSDRSSANAAGISLTPSDSNACTGRRAPAATVPIRLDNRSLQGCPQELRQRPHPRLSQLRTADASLPPTHRHATQYRGKHTAK
jgi:hypothetical protein